MIRIGDEYEDKGNVQNTVSAFVGYKDDKLSLGAEYNSQTNFGHAEDYDRSGISAFAALQATDKVAIFGRFDQVGNSTDTPVNADGNWYIGGVEYKILKNLKASLNAQSFQSEADGGDEYTYGFLSIDFKF